MRKRLITSENIRITSEKVWRIVEIKTEMNLKVWRFADRAASQYIYLSS